MKIAMDFLRAGQEWSPDTGEQQNYLILAFSGREFRFEVTEREAEDFISQAMGGASVATEPYEGPTDNDLLFGEEYAHEEDPQIEEILYEREEDLPRNTEGDLVFGGDMAPVEAPTMFDTANLPAQEEPERPPPPQSPADRAKELRESKLAGRPRPTLKMKERVEKLRAKSRKRPAKRVDADEAGHPIVPPRQSEHAGPAVQHQPHTTSLDGDDDVFGQG